MGLLPFDDEGLKLALTLDLIRRTGLGTGVSDIKSVNWEKFGVGTVGVFGTVESELGAGDALCPIDRLGPAVGVTLTLAIRSLRESAEVGGGVTTTEPKTTAGAETIAEFEEAGAENGTGGGDSDDEGVVSKLGNGSPLSPSVSERH